MHNQTSKEQARREIFLKEQKRFKSFLKELTALSQKHNIALSTVGGVHVFEEKEKLVFDYLKYADVSSGDLMPWVDGECL